MANCTLENINILDNIQSKCDFVVNNCEELTDLVNFINFFYCDIHGNLVIIILISIIFVVFSFNFFGTIADIYLGPTLEILSEKLKFSAAIAGCTLLAFANGAPDVISGIVAGGKTTDGLQIAIGGLFGACLFTCTIVLARCIQGGSEIKVSSKCMINDIGTLLAAVVYFIILTFFDDIPWWLTIGFFLIYIEYIVFVFLREKRKEKIKQKIPNLKHKLRLEFAPRTTALLDQKRKMSLTGMASNFLVKQRYKKAVRKGKSIKLDDFASFHESDYASDNMTHHIIEEEDDDDTTCIGQFTKRYTAILTFITDLTMPPFEKQHWNYFKVVLSPILAGVFIAIQFQFFMYKDVGFWLIFVGITLPPTIWIAIAGRNRNLAEDYNGIFSAVTFVISSLWINLVATIFMDWLSMVALISGLPINFLSLTLLAWGNSLGDFFVNYVISKNGQGEMAVVGTYSGQIFNLLCGFGGAIFRQTLVNSPVNLQYLYQWSSTEDPSQKKTQILTMVLILTTFFGLLLSLLVAKWKNWKRKEKREMREKG